MASQSGSMLIKKSSTSSFTPAVKLVAPATKPATTTGTAATPTTPKPPPSAVPFMGPNEYAAVAAHLGANTMAQIEADNSVAVTAANTAYQKQVNDEQARYASRDANDAAGARGIFGSSINQGDLADIEGKRARANANLDAQLAQAQLHHNAVIAAITNVGVGSPEWNFWQGINSGMVQNARNINEQLTPEQMPVGTTPGASQPAASASAQQTAAQKQTQANPRPTGSEWSGSNVFQQSSGPRAGQWYRVEKRGSSTYRVYSNGETIKIS